MTIKKLSMLLCACLLFSGCGKERGKAEHSHSKWEIDRGFTEEVLLYRNSSTERVEYYDYRTGHYGPLCGKPNCLHEDPECMAYYLGDSISQMGRLGDKWYYVKIEYDGRQVFCSCDIDGANEREIGEFSHGISYQNFFWEDSCIFMTDDPIFDEESEEWLGSVRGIYQYHLDTGESEILCPEKESMYAVYQLYGQYEDVLLYGEEMGDGFEVRVMDLKTHEIQKPLEDVCVINGLMSENLLLCGIQEGNNFKLIEFDLDSGERKEVMETDDKEGSVIACWSPDLKLITILYYEDNSADFRYEVYQYREDGECVLAREGDQETYLQPIAIKDDRIIGRYGDAGDNSLKFDLAVINKEDFFAGKCNWEVLQY